MSQTSSILDSFHELARERDLEYFIIGGYAASFWGTPRFTADVDYVVEASRFELVIEIMSSLEYALAFKHPRGSFAHFSASNSSSFRVDFMFVNNDTWQKLKSKGSSGDFGGKEPFPVVGPLHLIAMKIHSASQPDRTEYIKDLQDVVAIMQRQKISYEFLQSEGIIEKFGKADIPDKLRNMLKRLNNES